MASKNPIEREHVVRKGENLFQISRLYGATVYDLLDWNPKLKGKNALIHPGDRLVVFTRS
ncbi:LysM peptidoglycan-binding domain-containing protein [bacterium]|nr:LysM peptidoglycan-binding domain-containing protein [bacterium]